MLIEAIEKEFLTEKKFEGLTDHSLSYDNLFKLLNEWLSEEGIEQLEDLTKESLTKGIKLMRQDDSPRIVKTEDVKIALSHLRRQKRREKTFTSWRNHTLILLLVGSGMRLGEVERLGWSDIDFSDWLITISKSKSRKTQSIPLSEQLAKELLEWRLFLERKFDNLPSSVFVTEQGKALSSSAIQNVFTQIGHKTVRAGE